MNPAVRWFVSYGLLSLLAGCASAPTAAPLVTAPVSTTLSALYDEYFEASLALHPTSATYIGDHRYDDRFENPADPAFAAQVRDLEARYLARARSVDVSGLSTADRISHDIFVEERSRALEGLKFPDRLLPLDQMNNLASEFALLASGTGAQPFLTAQDYERFLGRSRDFVRWADAAIVAFREGAARGVVHPRVVVEKLLPQLEALAEPDLENTLFWRSVKGMPDSIPPAERARLTALCRAAIADEILPAYRRLAQFLRTEYLPRTRSTVGWSALPDGQAWYRFKIRRQVTADMTADEIHAIGLTEVARIRAEMTAVMREVGFKGDLPGFFAYVQRDDRFYFATPEKLLDGYRDLQKRIDALLPALFKDFPRANYQVRAVEPFRAASAAGASYWAPSADGKRPGIFYVNTFNLRAQPIYGMETLSLHEASPGHHFQISIQQELQELPRFRRFSGYTVYAEGWALYVESIGKELGLFTDPMQWYGRLSDEMLRAMRLVVDTGLHARGWTREQAIQYMHENSSMAQSDIVAEVERYIAWPAQALAYKVGQLRISAMRARAERELGAAFDVREFHSQVLRDGALPMDVLEAKINRWIASAKAR